MLLLLLPLLQWSSLRSSAQSSGSHSGMSKAQHNTPTVVTGLEGRHQPQEHSYG